MGKTFDFSNKRKCLMKNLKKISENLENCPPCQVKPSPYGPCYPTKACQLCGPLKCKCILVQNCSSTSSNPRAKCGPFPDSCTTISLPKKSCAAKSTTLASKCPFHLPCCQFNNGVMCKRTECCCRKRCSPQIYPCEYCCSVPRCCACPKRCCLSSCGSKIRNCTPFCCKNCRCSRRNFECTHKKNRKGDTVGNLCLGCNTICLHRCNSGSQTVVQKKGKPLTCSKSVELRGSKLVRGCDCDKRNGLQDRCMRYCCINNPKCRTIPASCHCSKFSCGKNSSIRYGKRKNKSYTCYICGPPSYPCRARFPVTCCCKRYCQKKCDTECQCSPTTCEAECRCQPCSEPCSPEPRPCLSCLPPAEPCSCPEPCVPCTEKCCPPVPCPQPCNETYAPCIQPFPTSCCFNCENGCICDGSTNKIGENCTCDIDNCPPHCVSCQTHHY